LDYLLKGLSFQPIYFGFCTEEPPIYFQFFFLSSLSEDESNGKTRTKTEKTTTLQMKFQQHQPKQQITLLRGWLFSCLGTEIILLS